MTKKILFVLPLLAFFAGCGSPFFDETYIRQLPQSPGEENKIIFLKTAITFTPAGERIDTDHILLRVGANLRARPDILQVEDNDISKLIDFRVRLLQSGGNTQTFDRDALYKEAASSSAQISEDALYILPVKDYMAEGDIMEIVSVHKNLMPRFGLNYSVLSYGMSADSAQLQIHLPPNYAASFLVVHDMQAPVQWRGADSSQYLSFTWKSVEQKKSNIVFAEKNTSPGVLFAWPGAGKGEPFSWEKFGDWYLSLIRYRMVPDGALKKKTDELVAGLTTDTQKLSALFNYCQKNIRYEQVYLEKGGFIPNDCNSILQHGYADCKDYTTLLYVMAKYAGLHVAPALCYWGRGLEAFYDIPVTQFNHMLLYFNDNGKESWYDGTNRDGKPGITTADLINQTALVLEENNSRLVSIKENEETRLSVTADFTGKQSDLEGDMSIQLNGQYGTDFCYLDFVENPVDLGKYLTSWVQKYFCKNFLIGNISGRKTEAGYEILLRGTIPNALTVIDTNSFFSVLHLFPDMIPAAPQKQTEKDVFYYPAYDKVNLNIKIKNLYVSGQSPDMPFYMQASYELPAGPFTLNSRESFIKQLQKTESDLQKKIKLSRMD